MPASMIHLALAHRLNPEGSGWFYIGNLAPDAMEMRLSLTREEKDAQHLRSHADRWAALGELAHRTNSGDDFQEGYLIHLFCDAHWDAEMVTAYQAAHAGEEQWFPGYRGEISRGSRWLFHHLPWCQTVWQRILASSFDFDNPTGNPTNAEIEAYCHRVYDHHGQWNPDKPEFFTIERIDAFIENIARRYPLWREETPGAVAGTKGK